MIDHLEKRLFIFTEARERHPEVDQWLARQSGELGDLARHWFTVIRNCGQARDDISELLHDGHPTACVNQAAFAYVDVFTHHVNLGFYQGAGLDDPEGLLQGTGRIMRHVKLRPDQLVEEASLRRLIKEAYVDMQAKTASDR